MTDPVLTPERILDSTEEVLRRFGPAKATVVDVARVLKVSHGSVYRHFASKSALLEAVAARWLARVMAPLAKVVARQDLTPTVKLKTWLETLIEIKHSRLRDDPELFTTYFALAKECAQMVQDHIDDLVSHLSAIVSEGVRSGEFQTADPVATAKAVLDATSRFHHPAHAQEWSLPDAGKSFEAVWSLLLRGLSPAG